MPYPLRSSCSRSSRPPPTASWTGVHCASRSSRPLLLGRPAATRSGRCADLFAELLGVPRRRCRRRLLRARRTLPARCAVGESDPDPARSRAGPARRVRGALGRPPRASARHGADVAAEPHRPEATGRHAAVLRPGAHVVRLPDRVNPGRLSRRPDLRPPRAVRRCGPGPGPDRCRDPARGAPHGVPRRTRPGSLASRCSTSTRSSCGSRSSPSTRRTSTPRSKS